MVRVEIEPGKWQHTCQNCGAVRTTKVDLPYNRDCIKPQKRERKKRPPCMYLGGELRRVEHECKTCGGTKRIVQLKVYACPKFGECTIGKRVEGVACCAICDKHEAKPSG